MDQEKKTEEAKPESSVTSSSSPVESTKESSGMMRGIPERKLTFRPKNLKYGMFSGDTLQPLSDFLGSNHALTGSTLYDTYRLGRNIGSNVKSEKELELAEQNTQLQRQLRELQNKKESGDEERVAREEEFNVKYKELNEQRALDNIVSRLSEQGKEKIFASEEFRNLFKNGQPCEAVVMSIDIRRSTELMLKARTPQLFSTFITDLSDILSAIVISNFGVFDKFTGDGILAFFPKFYSGEQAIIRAIKAATDCHEAFKQHYHDSEACFNVFLNDVGLGIGIDYGTVTILQTPRELTIVGVPVVYACRFSGAKAGETLLNIPAKEEVEKQCPDFAMFKKSFINIKNEGEVQGYNVSLNAAAYKISEPDWDDLIKEYGPKEDTPDQV